jgi:hypothetical protein
MQADRHRPAHERMPGRVELDHIQPLTPWSVRLELRHALVRHPRQFLRLRRGHVMTDRIELLAQRAMQPRGEIDDQWI